MRKAQGRAIENELQREIGEAEGNVGTTVKNHLKATNVAGLFPNEELTLMNESGIMTANMSEIGFSMKQVY